MKLIQSFKIIWGYGLFITLLFAVIYFWFGFNGLYGQDAHEYYRYAKALKDFFVTGDNPGDYFWPVYYPLLGALVSFSGLNVLFVLQLLSLLALCGIVLYVRKLLGLLYPEETVYKDIFLIVSLGLSPFMLRAGLLVMSDMLAVFFLVAATYYCLQYLRERRIIYLLPATLLTLMAIMTRYPTGLVLLPFVIVVANTFFKSPKWVYLVPVSVILVLVLVPHVLIRGADSVDFMAHEWLLEWSPVNFFTNQSNLESGGYNAYSVFNLLYATAGFWFPGYLFYGLIVIPFIRWKDIKANYLLWIAIAVYALFLAGIPYQNKRYLLLTFPFIVLVLYPAVVRLIAIVKIKQVLVYVTAIIAVIIQLVLFGYATQKLYERNRLEQVIAATLKNQPQDTVYAFDVDVSFASYNVPQRVWNLWITEYPYFKKGALVVFNEQEIGKQWRGKTPMFNWERLNVSHELVELKTFEKGWKLYEIR